VKQTGGGFGTGRGTAGQGFGWQRFRGAKRARCAKAESPNALRPRRLTETSKSSSGLGMGFSSPVDYRESGGVS